MWRVIPLPPTFLGPQEVLNPLSGGGQYDAFVAKFDSSLATYTVPVAATLVSPSGTIYDTTPTYTWHAVSNATWYLLWVNDSSGVKIQEWYTAADAGCPLGTGLCSVTPTTQLASGAAMWWILTWNDAGYGPWSTGMSFTVSAAPGAAILISPSKTIPDTTPTYTWNAVAGSTWYYLWVDDSTSAGLGKIKQWYTAAQAGCASGTGTCSVTPATALTPGAGTWWIQTYSNVYGAWSSGMHFTVTPPRPAILVSPSGTIHTTTPTYTWMAVPESTWYYLWVDDSSQSGKIKQWYTAAQAGCASGTGTCSVTPATALAPGACTWWIQTYSSVLGAWSSGMHFTVSP